MQIGLTQDEPAWEILLRQIGIAFKVISDHDSFANDFSMIIVNSTADSAIQQRIEDFSRQGGALLYTTKSVKEIKNRTHTSIFVNSLPPTKKELYEFYNILDLYSDVVYFQNNEFVEIVQAGDGWKIFFGIDVGIVLTSDVKRKNFFRDTGRMPNEIVAKRNKGMLRQLIFSLLVKIHHLQQIPFVHQWYYPDSEPTIFTMRIDSDKGSQAQIEHIYQVSETFSIPTTWFLDVKSHEAWLPYFQKFLDQEIGVHCYEHVVHTSAVLNKENFGKALNLLRQNKLEPKGISAPTGGWNKQYAEAIQSLGFHYSSEFAYDYDNLPSYPFINGHFLPLPQLPIHPVCIGSMVRARMSEEEMVRYYRAIIDKNYLLNEPIALYHHPTHEHNGIFEEVFRYINERNIRKLSFSEYSDWWKYRTSNLVPLKFSDGIFDPLAKNTSTHYRIIRSDGSESTTAMNGKIDIKSIPFRRIDREILPNEHLMRSRSFDPGHILQNALDWWIKTTE